MRNIPEPVARFLACQTTEPFEFHSEPAFPYSQFYWRVIACILLSGRVAPKNDQSPNLTDATRVGKEASFNQHLIVDVGRTLVNSGIIRFEWSLSNRKSYQEGPYLEAFWEMDIKGLRAATRLGFLSFFETARTHRKLYQKDLEEIADSGLVELLALFFGLFPDRALKSSIVGRMLREFAELPVADLCHLARDHGIDERKVKENRWAEWLDDRGQGSVRAALYSIGWANTTDESGEWIFLNRSGRAMLSLAEPPPRPQLPADLEVCDDSSILAGVGAPLARLLPLFRHCKIKKLHDTCKLKVDKKAIQQTSATDAIAELTQVLQDFEPLPPALRKLLVSQKPIGGALRYRFCSGIVKPADAAMLKAIRTHPKLKGYIEPGGPPGYLLIKPDSRFDNFLIRCRELGFELTTL